MDSSPAKVGRNFFALVAILAVSGCRALAQSSTEPVHPPFSAQQRGAEIYSRMCAVCHGARGEGYKADQASALADPDFLASVADDFLRRATAEGRTGTTMSAWAVDRGGPLSQEDISAVIAFIRTWDHLPRAKLDDRPPSGSVSRGAAIFADNCAKCHGTKGRGGPNINIGNPQLLQTAGNGFLRHAIRFGRKNTPMSGFGGALGNDAIEDLMALLRNWESTSTAQAQIQPPAPPAPLPLGPVPLNPQGPEPTGFHAYPAFVSVDLAKTQLDLHARMAFLDARAPSDYIHEHIAGAVSVPFYDPSPYVSALPKDAWLICYCACPHAESGQLAQKLLNNGFSKVAVLDEGFIVWKSRGYGTRSGSAP